MRGQKIIDCIEMKNRIQAELLSEYQGLAADEERRKRLDKLSSGDSPVARLWQAAAKRREAAAK